MTTPGNGPTVPGVFVSFLGAFDLTQGCVMSLFEERMRTIFSTHGQTK